MVVGWFWGLGFLVFSLGLIAFRVYRALGFRVRRLGGDHTMGGGGVGEPRAGIICAQIRGQKAPTKPKAGVSLFWGTGSVSAETLGPSVRVGILKAAS